MQKPKLFVFTMIVVVLCGSAPSVFGQAGETTSALTLNLDRYGALRVDQQEIPFGSFIDRVKQIASAQPGASVTVVAEESAPFRDVVRIVDAVRAAGVDRVGLLTQKSDAGAARNAAPSGAMILSLDRNSVVRLNGKQIKLQNLRRELTKTFRNRTNRSIFVQAHAGLPFDVVATLIDAAKGAGAGAVGLLTVEE